MLIKEEVVMRYSFKQEEKMKEVLQEFFDLSHELYVWADYIPFREGLNALSEKVYLILHALIETDNKLMSVPDTGNIPNVYVVEVASKKVAGETYLLRDIYMDVNDEKVYAEYEIVKEVSKDEFDELSKARGSKGWFLW